MRTALSAMVLALCSLCLTACGGADAPPGVLPADDVPFASARDKQVGLDPIADDCRFGDDENHVRGKAVESHHVNYALTLPTSGNHQFFTDAWFRFHDSDQAERMLARLSAAISRCARTTPPRSPSGWATGAEVRPLTDLPSGSIGLEGHEGITPLDTWFRRLYRLHGDVIVVVSLDGQAKGLPPASQIDLVDLLSRATTAATAADRNG